MMNKKYKDRLFRMIFGYEKYKGNLLSLYNVLNDTDYTNPDDLEITTIEDAIWMGMKNDVSCIINCDMALYEHQSTFNPNMPLRGFMYLGKLYNKYVEMNKKNIYGKKLIKLPTPQYYVFYNGKKNYPDRMELKLSDAFQTELKGGGFEWTAVMLNINFGRNQKLLDSCQIIREYAILIETIRRKQKSCMDLEEAINRAVSECIENNVLAEFLLEQKSEVIDMLLTEYNEEETMEMLREEAREEAREEERLETKKDDILELLMDLGSIPPKLERKIREQADLKVLSHWHKLAAKAETIEEFFSKL